MRARILKECRALLPVWAVAILLVVVPALLWRSGAENGVWIPAFGLGAIFLCVTSFGKEFAHGTYGLLLTQPVSRWRVWWEKTLVLGVALASLLGAAWALTIALVALVPEQDLFMALSVTLLIAAAAYGGGLCLTLLLRQANGAFWLTLFFPAVVCLAVEWVVHKLSPEADAGPWLIVALVVYSAAAYVLGLRLFLKRQDVAWGSGDVTIPLAPTWLAPRVAAAQPGSRFGGLAAMLYKELHVQQVNLLGGVLLVLMFLSALATRRSDTQIGGIELREFLRGLYWMVWGLMPFLIGAVAIAEERRLGLLEWQQSLPVSRRRQFLTKFLFACTLSVFLGALLPWLLDALAYLVTDTSVSGMTDILRNPADWRSFTVGLGITLGLPVLAIAATTVGVFASSLARNLLQALSVIVGLITTTWALVALFVSGYRSVELSPALLLGLVGLPTLVVVLGWLAFRNYCEAVPGARLWRRNLAVLLVSGAFVMGTTAALYARAWEIFIPETRISTLHVHGPAVPKIAGQLFPFFILLPDGTLWEWKPTAAVPEPPPVRDPGTWQDVGSRVVPGKGNDYTIEALALKADGTLWRWRYFSTTNSPFRRQTEPVRFGAERDWKAIVGGGTHLVALKTDGSLWAWGNNAHGQLGDGTTVDRTAPVRIGLETNWAQATASWGASLALKTDGSLWEWGQVGPPAGGSFILGAADHGSAELMVCPSPRRVDHGTNWARGASSSPGGSSAIQTDGSLWRWSDYRLRVPGVSGAVVLGPNRIGNDRDWAQVVIPWNLSAGAVGLKKDGSLWTWELLPWAPTQTWQPVRKSRQGPWLAAAPLGSDSAVALAADGSVWMWGNPFVHELAETDSHHRSSIGSLISRLIPPSHRPHRIATLTAEPSR